MTAFLRRCLFCLLAIALPLQGLAAVTMGVAGSCAGHTVAMTAMAMGTASGHHGDDSMTTGHGDHGRQGHASPEKKPANKAKTASCAACYAFSLPAGFVLADPALPAAAPLRAPAIAFAGHQPDGLERPPKPFLA